MEKYSTHHEYAFELVGVTYIDYGMYFRFKILMQKYIYNFGNSNLKYWRNPNTEILKHAPAGFCPSACPHRIPLAALTLTYTQYTLHNKNIMKDYTLYT